MAITYRDENGEKVATRVGCVLDTGEMNYHDDSDFYAVIWDEDSQRVIRVEYATTRFSCTGDAQIDATPETIAKASAYVQAELAKMWLEADKQDARVPRIGRKVRIVKGRPSQTMADKSKVKLPLGTEGTVFFREERRSMYGTWSHGFRVGIALSDKREPGFTLTVEADGTTVVSAPYNEELPWHARALGGTWDKPRKVWAFPVTVESDLVAGLFNNYFPGKYQDICYTDEKNVEVVNPEQYEHTEAEAQAWASKRSTCWRAFTHPRRPDLAFI